MPSTKRPPNWFRTGLRFCGSSVITLSCWAAWLVLTAMLVMLVYIALVRDLPVPGFILRRSEAELARSGLVLQFGRAHFNPTGKIVLENVQLRSRPFDDPLLTCRLLYIRHNFWSMLAGRTMPEDIRLEGASLLLPAMLSPTGTTEPVIRDLAVELHRSHNRWQVTQFAGRFGRLALTARGEFSSPTTTAGTMPLSLETFTSRFLQVAKVFSRFLHRLDAFDEPSLNIRLEVDPALGNLADLLFTSGKVHRPWDLPLSLGPLVASARLQLDGRGPHPLQIQLATQQAVYSGKVVGEEVRAIIRAELRPGDFTGRPLEIRAAASSVDFSGERMLGPGLLADLSAWPLVRSTAATQLDGEIITTEVEAQLTAQTARLHAEGRVTAGLIRRVLSEHTPRAAPYFVFGDPVEFAADTVLAAGWRFDHLHSRVAFGRLDSSGVKITSGRGRLDLTRTSLLAQDAQIIMGDNLARGSYWMNFASTDYRMLLEGRLRPADINGWFRGNWWLAFWNKYFDFPLTPPAGEMDLQGRWREPSLSHTFIQASIRSATVWGGDFEQVNATVFARPNFTHGLMLKGTRAGGTQSLTGTFKRFGTPGSREPARFEFDFTANADTAVLGRMLEGRADDVLASLRFTQPPQVHAWGAIDGGIPAYRFTGEARGGFHYYGFPLETVAVAGGVGGSEVHLGEIKFTTAGGKGSGRASLAGPPDARRLGFDLSLTGAQLGRTIHAVKEYDANRLGQPYVASPESKFVQQASASSLDVTLAATGDPNSVASFTGSGTAALTEAKLGEIHLFGLLSQVLSGLSLSFSSLKLDSATSSFDLQNGALLFRDLKVKGPSALIDGQGQYTIASNALDFSAKFKPYDQPGSLLAAAVSLVMNPLSSLIDLKLGGRLDDPKWSFAILSSNTSSPLPPPKPAEPAIPVPAP